MSPVGPVGPVSPVGPVVVPPPPAYSNCLIALLYTIACPSLGYPVIRGTVLINKDFGCVNSFEKFKLLLIFIKIKNILVDKRPCDPSGMTEILLFNLFGKKQISYLKHFN
jgi:hypothetical protein